MGERVELHGDDPEDPHSQAAGTQCFAMDVDEVPAAGSRPDRLTEVRPQERVLRRTVEQNVEPVRRVPVLDAPVPQMVVHIVDVLKIIDRVCPSRLSKCPRFLFRTWSRSASLFASRSWRNSWWKCRRTPVTLLLSWPCEPLGGGQHWLCLSSSTPPAQGGIQILGRAEAVVDISVIMQPQFPQSFVKNVEVPQTQFFDRVAVQLLHRDRYTVQTVHKSVEIAQVQFLDLLGHPLLYNDRSLGLTEQKTVEVPQLQCSDKVYDVPVVQVVVRVEGASDSVHRQSWVMTAVKGLSPVFCIFRAPPGCPGVERQLQMKSSSSSRARGWR